MEEWRDVKGYEGLYKVSSYGRVRSVDGAFMTRGKSGFCKPKPGVMLSPKTNQHGYLEVNLSKDRTYKMHMIHRLVAFAFIPNPNGYPIVNHKDEVRTNNHVENLEWCTKSYNYLYNGACFRNNPTKKAVSQFTKDGELVKTFRSMKSAARETGIWLSAIANVAARRLHYNTAGGYVWRYAE